MNSPLDVVIRLLLAAALGGIVGWEREVINRPAGFRTHIIVCAGSALLMIVSTEMFFVFQGLATVDPGRIAAQVVSGVGFLGAGTILREGVNIKGLTTAASLWAIAGVGLAAGLGLFIPAAVGTAVIILSLTFLNRLEYHWVTNKKHQLLQLEITDTPGKLGAIGTVLGQMEVEIRRIKLTPGTVPENVVVQVMLQIPVSLKLNAVISALLSIPGVSCVEQPED